jgi:hypothetical protein
LIIDDSGGFHFGNVGLAVRLVLERVKVVQTKLRLALSALQAFLYVLSTSQIDRPPFRLGRASSSPFQVTK